MIPAIRVQGISKQYFLGEGRGAHRTLRDALAEALRFPWLRRIRSGADKPKEFWALKDVSFDVEPGEVIGLIGRNGAGKSTLLKILSQITDPTQGEVQLHGRVGSLLEVGTGFHGELTGRENVFLSGVILGMTRREVRQRFDEIVEFSEIGDFIDTPVKRYSSGMYVRLGFAVAAILTPEIMLVDEVLAVGDQPFQKKCLGRMNEVSRSGRTVIFVSHNMPTIESLCQRTLWLSGGQVTQFGPTKEVVRNYLDRFGAVRSQATELANRTDRTGTGNVRFEHVELLAVDGSPLGVYQSGDGLRVRLHYQVHRQMASLHFGVRIFTNHGTKLTDVHTWTTGEAVPLAREGPGCIEVTIDSLNLMPGSYPLGIWAGTAGDYHDVLENAVTLDVEASDFYGTGRGVEARFGTIFLPFRWQSVEQSNSKRANRSMDLATAK
jgi:lipopolysaccharide transport system ATP-binding protein